MRKRPLIPLCGFRVESKDSPQTFHSFNTPIRWATRDPLLHNIKVLFLKRIGCHSSSSQRSRQEDSGSCMAVGSGSNKQPPISRPSTGTNGSCNAMSGLSGTGSLVLSSLLSPAPTACNGLAQSIAATLSTSGGSTSPTNQMINGMSGQCNGLKSFMMDRPQQQQQLPPPQHQYLSGIPSPLPNLSLSQVSWIVSRKH